MKKVAVLILTALIIALSIWANIPAQAQETQPSQIDTFPQIQFV